MFHVVVTSVRKGDVNNPENEGELVFKSEVSDLVLI